jgi:cyanophycinase
VLLRSSDKTNTNGETVDKGCPIYAENLKVHHLTENWKIDLDSGRIKGSVTLLISKCIYSYN